MEAQPTTPTRSRLGKLGSIVRRGSASPSFRAAPDSAKVFTEDWYIPYTGPVAAPKTKERRRDSWGDLVDEELDNYMRESDAAWQGQWRRGNEDPQRGRSRNRASGASRMTMSSGTVDPSRKSFVSTKPPKVPPLLPSARKATPSYISLDPSGGVGDTPLPVQRNSRTMLSNSPQSGLINRRSIASIFSFGKPVRSSTYGPAKEVVSAPYTLQFNDTSSLRLRTQAVNHHDDGPATAPPLDTYNTPFQEADDIQFTQYANPTPRPQQVDDRSSLYSTGSQSNSRLPSAQIPRSTHPYALATPFQPSKAVRLVTPRLPSTNSVPKHLRPMSQKKLKSSVSTPNLRAVAQQQGPPNGLPNGAERWLSAETWCDVFMRPRPRFKLTLVDDDGRQIPQLLTSGRIVSPPPSPIFEPSPSFASRQAAASRQTESKQTASVSRHTNSASRHTASQAEQQSSQAGHASSSAHVEEDESIREIPRRVRTATLPSRLPPPPPRNKANRYSKDDLNLPSPLPSLANVLRDGEKLASDRAAWQQQATHSFMNKRSRSLSRSGTRKLVKSRSLTRVDSPEKGVSGSFDFLAARTLHGHNAFPAHISAASSKASAHTQSGFGTVSSLSRARTHSQTHSRNTSFGSARGRGHTRNESWGKSALKKAKSTAALCLDGDASSMSGAVAGASPAKARVGDRLEDELRRSDGTRVIRLSDQLYVDARNRELKGSTTSPSAALGLIGNRHFNVPAARSGSSATHSNDGDAPIGLALTMASPEQQRVEQEPIVFESHPFAHYSVERDPRLTPAQDRVRETSQPPTPVVVTGALPPLSSNVATRHRLPPHASLSQSYVQHPYAAAFGPSGDDDSSRRVPSEYIPVSPTRRLYAEVPSGNIREVRPEELLYSPATTAAPSLASKQKKAAARYSETLGVAEALSFAFGRSRSGTVSSTGRHIQEDAEGEEGEAQAFAEGEQEQEGAEDRHPPAPPPPVRQAPVNFGSDTQNTSGSGSNLADKLTPPSQLHSEHSYMGSHSSGSVGISPNVHGSADEDFADLFYRPDQPDQEVSKSENLKTAISRGGSSSTDPHFDESLSENLGSAPSSRTGSGLTRLARQLSEEYSEFREDDTFGVPMSMRHTEMVGSRQGGLMGERNGPVEDINSVLARSGNQATDRSPSPHGMALPLRFSQGEDETLHGATAGVPEDVKSTASSSMTNRAASPDSPTIEHFRVRSVTSSSTPYPEDNEYRASATLSLILDNFDAELREFTAHADAHRPLVTNGDVSHINTVDPRTSYMTADTAGSRISGLSDFPAPPDHRIVDHQSLMEAIASEGPTPAETIYHTPAVLTPIPSASGHSHEDHVEPASPISPADLNPNYAHLSAHSYVTSNTDTSRMSGLSDFPMPPLAGDFKRGGEPELPSPLNTEVNGPFRTSTVEAEHPHLHVTDGDVTIHADSGPEENMARNSAMTDGTNVDSRISGLSDFPLPPTTRSTPTHTVLLQSYFMSPSGTPEPGNSGLAANHRQGEDIQPSSRSSRRTTFGVDVGDNIAPPASPS